MRKPLFHTRVGKYDIPVFGADNPTLLAFLDAKAGKGGYYAFWVAEFKRPVNDKRAVWGRAKIGMPAGDRFDRMGRERHDKSLSAEDRAVYDAFWKMMGAGKNVKLIRPCNREETYAWLRTHTHKVFGRFKPVEMVAD